MVQVDRLGRRRDAVFVDLGVEEQRNKTRKNIVMIREFTREISSCFETD